MRSTIGICTLAVVVAITASSCSAGFEDTAPTTVATTAPSTTDRPDTLVPTPDDDMYIPTADAAAWGERYCALAREWVDGLDRLRIDSQGRLDAAATAQDQVTVVREYYETAGEITDALMSDLAELGPPGGDDGVYWLQDLQLLLGRISLATIQASLDIGLGSFDPDADLRAAITSADAGFEDALDTLRQQLKDPTTYILDAAYAREISSC